VWHRYTGDGYGEHDDGRAFDGTGRGRGWPLLTGERGHYALAAGDDPLPYLAAMAAMAQRGLLPEQIWDAAPVGRMQPGRPTGGAMPLAWAHAEFVKLVASRRAGHPVDRVDAVWARYRGERPQVDTWIWTPAAPVACVPRDCALLIVLPGPARLHLGYDGWRDAQDRECTPQGLGFYGLRIEPAAIAGRDSLDFTWQDPRDGLWHAGRYRIALGVPATA
jgi:glucoamylase